jgi:hypothetical protein
MLRESPDLSTELVFDPFNDLLLDIIDLFIG